MADVAVEHWERLSRLPVLNGTTFELTELGGGLTNTNLLVSVTAAAAGSAPVGRYVARCSNGGEELLGIDRSWEEHNSRAAAQAGVGAQVWEYSAELGVLLIGFLAGETLTNERLAAKHDSALLGRMADAMRRLHAGPAFIGEFNMFRRQEAYLAIVQEQNLPLPDGYLDFDEHWTQVRAVLEPRRTALVSCNNDLLAGNFIDDGQQIWLIDYEYSGLNDPTFELGNTVTECELTAEQTAELVSRYFGREEPTDLAAVRLQSLCAQYGWSLWGFIQASLSPLDYDFAGWGQERFDRAAATFTSPTFTRLLEQLT